MLDIGTRIAQRSVTVHTSDKGETPESYNTELLCWCCLGDKYACECPLVKPVRGTAAHAAYIKWLDELADELTDELAF